MSVRITKQRIRITFGKVNSLRFIGHLDVAKMWERVLRRAQLPLEYTRGFNRRPRTQFASALSLGFTSDCELIDVWLEDVIEINEQVKAQLQAVSPRDLLIHAVEDIDIDEPALQNIVDRAVYRIEPPQDQDFPADFEERMTHILSTDEIIRQRKKKDYNLRPFILSLALVDKNICRAELSMGEGKTGRPQDLLDELGLGDLNVRVHREAIHLQT